ncbi:hypothetical protein AMAG_10908 [Allomyces macrogynus ATCC 38327]|uniref:Uncharacterized protein n=1 Tax=Allomyces macrogynus (strain ATCC 38327) TaxID=578462 RepID=A0A0L0SSC2_ALLM3|nr:hypothetical protein AMAG_10908 [Allomyces macrogynus ATCC 38327]|eukprot:KNE65264.1 hypothetical protein AMAG_10908 [Allomyces macrogynus ATCC 38327]
MLAAAAPLSPGSTRSVAGVASPLIKSPTSKHPSSPNFGARALAAARRGLPRLHLPKWAAIGSTSKDAAHHAAAIPSPPDSDASDSEHEHTGTRKPSRNAKSAEFEPAKALQSLHTDFDWQSPSSSSAAPDASAERGVVIRTSAPKPAIAPPSPTPSSCPSSPELAATRPTRRVQFATSPPTVHLVDPCFDRTHDDPETHHRRGQRAMRLTFRDLAELLALRSVLRAQHARAHAPGHPMPATGICDHSVCGCGAVVKDADAVPMMARAVPSLLEMEVGV